MLLLDPEEFLNLLFGKALNATPFIELASGQTSYMYQLFVINDESQTTHPTVQDLFEKSLEESGVTFRNLPKLLILQMPRIGVKEKVFEQIQPSEFLDVTDFIEEGKRKYDLS